ncbi:hypothetical protein GL263_12990 [Streptomyces durbertensis]|uniref:Integral membrane protein n=1 Tax=Streptomyces durbertensis TaxID=2448886 RepID=A0ABR6EGL4_9ACTN|nr:hypothetical protein [Streptomyces durbertensis]MBB1244471.1 hypothetical protein [Streptomyces durbertensis]
MDQRNVFDTPVTARLHRAEYLVAFAVTTGFAVAHLDEIRWPVAIALFLYIDVIGYIPGAIAFHRSKTKQIHKAYYVLYNTMHSLITQAAVIGAWCLFVGPEWALLAIPWHLFGDRGLFGNFYKPFGLHFEPVVDPRYEQLLKEVAARSGSGPVAPDPLPAPLDGATVPAEAPDTGSVPPADESVSAAERPVAVPAAAPGGAER